ncbi:MAG: C-type lectin domain-containing protein [bacterium]|nr:C-type lectin domain-containing protein [bacterium]
MRLSGDLESQYASTAEFVEKMKNHFQISKTCSADNLQNCFSETIITQTTKDGQTISKNNALSEIDDAAKIIGVIFSDGTSMLIKYNPDADIIDTTDNEFGRISAPQDGNVSDFSTFGTVFKYIIDINNTKSPNILGKDIMGDLSVEKKSFLGVSFEIYENTISSTNMTKSGAMVYCSEKNAHIAESSDINEIYSQYEKYKAGQISLLENESNFLNTLDSISWNVWAQGGSEMMGQQFCAIYESSLAGSGNPSRIAACDESHPVLCIKN